MPDLLKTATGRYIAFGATGLVMLYILSRKGVAGAVAANIAQGVANAATEAAQGVVIGLGKAAGIPETDADQCTRDLAAGEWVAASFSCPAPRYLSHVLGNEDLDTKKQKFINANQ